MQRIIEEEFSHATIISILHRLKHIRFYDRIVLLKEGKLLECDAPTTLLHSDSEFRSIYHQFQDQDR